MFSSDFLSFQLAPVRVFASADPGILSDEGERIEVLLDTEWAGSLAPGATLNVVIGSQGGNIPEALIKAIDNRAGDVITLSFGLCEQAAPVVTNELFDAFYAIANSLGQTVLVASGDDGGRDCFPQSLAPAVSGLASSPNVVAVGGTSFTLDPDGSVPANLVERVWEDSGGAGGGGRSIVFGMPRYQIAAGLAGLSSGRALPDLAVAASPVDPGYVVVEGGVAQIVGGTSAGTPALASALALVNQRPRQTRGGAGGRGGPAGLPRRSHWQQRRLRRRAGLRPGDRLGCAAGRRAGGGARRARALRAGPRLHGAERPRRALVCRRVASRAGALPRTAQSPAGAAPDLPRRRPAVRCRRRGRRALHAARGALPERLRLPRSAAARARPAQGPPALSAGHGAPRAPAAAAREPPRSDPGRHPRGAERSDRRAAPAHGARRRV